MVVTGHSVGYGYVRARFKVKVSCVVSERLKSQ